MDDKAHCLRFLVVGDWGRRGSLKQRAVADAMAQVADRFPLHFVISTGDNFYEDGISGLRDPLWHESFESVYEAPSLQVPWYVVIGNHDYRGSIQAQKAYTRRNPRWTFPDRYYTVPRPLGSDTGVQFIFLDTTPFLDVYKPGGAEFTPGVAEQDTEAQLHWLRHTLSTSSADWKIVVGHHPLLSGSRFHGDTEELRRTLAPLLERHRVQAYFCGHEHDLQHLHTGTGPHHFISGAGSEVRATSACPHTQFCRSTPGFAAASLDQTKLRVTYYDHEATRLYQTTRHRTRANASSSCPPFTALPPSITADTSP